MKTWDEIARHDGNLACLMRLIKTIRAGEGFCANALWYGVLKEFVVRSVGDDARDPALKGSGHYDIAYRALYDALPNCTHEEGWCGGYPALPPERDSIIARIVDRVCEERHPGGLTMMNPAKCHEAEQRLREIFNEK